MLKKFFPSRARIALVCLGKKPICGAGTHIRSYGEGRKEIDLINDKARFASHHFHILWLRSAAVAPVQPERSSAGGGGDRVLGYSSGKIRTRGAISNTSSISQGDRRRKWCTVHQRYDHER